MQSHSDSIDPTLRELLAMEVADIVATASEQGFSTEEILAGLAQAVANSQMALEQETDPAEDQELPAGPHSAPELTDPNKTPGSGALSEPGTGDVDPGVG